MTNLLLSKETLEALTLEDAYELCINDGLYMVFADGRLKHFTIDGKGKKNAYQQ